MNAFEDDPRKVIRPLVRSGVLVATRLVKHPWLRAALLIILVADQVYDIVVEIREQEGGSTGQPS